jgi:uncharacterized protein (UPF0335 family)
MTLEPTAATLSTEFSDDAPMALGGNAVSASAEIMKSAIERIEQLDEEIHALNASKSDVFMEMKATGFDVATIKWALKERRLDPAKRYDRDELRDLYARALGMTV